MALTITCLRHAHSEQTGGFETHRGWQLSDEGRACAQARREKLGNPTFDLVLHSPLIRTRQTALIVAGLPEDTEVENVVEVPELFNAATDEEQTILDQMFQELGHAPFEKYLRHHHWSVLDKLALRARVALGQLLFPTDRSSSSRTLLVGHAVLLPAFIHGWSAPFGIWGDAVNRLHRSCMQEKMGECEGYNITLFHKTFTQITDWYQIRN